MARVMGVDPGLAATGVGLVAGSGRRVTGFAYGDIRTRPRTPLPDRLNRIYDGMTERLTEDAPDLLVVEAVFSLARHPASGLALGRVTGVILLAAGRSGVPVVELAAREAKQALTGHGGASKAELERAVRRTLRLSDPIRPDHASDALALALIGLRRHRDPPFSRRAP
jgi:crossover junction endodeoxyribonuclease RuvC